MREVSINLGGWKRRIRPSWIREIACITPHWLADQNQIFFVGLNPLRRFRQAASQYCKARKGHQRHLQVVHRSSELDGPGPSRSLPLAPLLVASALNSHHSHLSEYILSPSACFSCACVLLLGGTLRIRPPRTLSPKFRQSTGERTIAFPSYAQGSPLSQTIRKAQCEQKHHGIRSGISPESQQTRGCRGLETMAQLGSPMCDSPTSFSESLYLQYDRQQSHLSTPNLNCAAVAAVAAADSFFSVSAQDHEPRIITIPQKAMRPDTMTTNTYTSSTSSDDWMRWTIILVMLALVLSTIVLGQVVATYSSAYLAAPREVATIIDTVDFSIQENESYDRDVNKVQRLEDKLRLGRLLREIQKTGDDLREELNSLLIDNETTTLRLSARAMWASRRVQLESWFWGWFSWWAGVSWWWV